MVIVCTALAEASQYADNPQLALDGRKGSLVAMAQTVFASRNYVEMLLMHVDDGRPLPT